MADKYVRFTLWLTPKQKRQVEKRGPREASAFIRSLIDNSKMKNVIGSLGLSVLLFSPLVSLAHTIDASASGGATISPSGSMTVAPGDSQAFALGSSDGTHITDVVVDGSSIGVVTSYLFDNVSADHSISVFAMGNPGGGLLYCSGPMAPGWNVSLPDGGCPKQAKAVYAPAFTIVEKDGSYTFHAGQRVQ